MPHDDVNKTYANVLLGEKWLSGCLFIVFRLKSWITKFIHAYNLFNKLSKMLTIVFGLWVEKTIDNCLLRFFCQKFVDVCLCFFGWKTANNYLWMYDRKSHDFNKFSFVPSNDLFSKILFIIWNLQTLKNFLKVWLDKSRYQLLHFNYLSKWALYYILSKLFFDC